MTLENSLKKKNVENFMPNIFKSGFFFDIWNSNGAITSLRAPGCPVCFSAHGSKWIKQGSIITFFLQI